MQSITNLGQGDAGTKLAALTFDDGPHWSNTPKLLDVVSKTTIKLTFFVLGQHAKQHPDILRRQASEGHEIGNHSWSHPDLTMLGPAEVQDEIQRTDEIITQHAGIKSLLFRPPYGRTTDALRQLLRYNFGYATILWTVDSLDWRIRDATAIADRILRNIRSGSIVLLHDIHVVSIEAILAVSESLLSTGYELVTVSELLQRTV